MIPMKTQTLLQATAYEVVWQFLNCGGDVLVIEGRDWVMTPIEPAVGRCWLVVYNHFHSSEMISIYSLSDVILLHVYQALMLSHQFDFYT